MKKNLTQWDEDVALPIIVKLLKENGPKTVSCNQLRTWLCNETGVFVLSSTMRSIIHIIRTKHLIFNLIANSKGYRISDDLNDVQAYIDSLGDRALQIHELQHALKIQLQKTLVGQLAIEEATCV